MCAYGHFQNDLENKLIIDRTFWISRQNNLFIGKKNEQKILCALRIGSLQSRISVNISNRPLKEPMSHDG